MTLSSWENFFVLYFFLKLGSLEIEPRREFLYKWFCEVVPPEGRTWISTKLPLRTRSQLDQIHSDPWRKLSKLHHRVDYTLRQGGWPFLAPCQSVISFDRGKPLKWGGSQLAEGMLCISGHLWTISSQHNSLQVRYDIWVENNIH